MTARSIATVLLLGIIVGLSVINLARATKDSEIDTRQLDAIGDPAWPGYAALPR